MYGLGVVDPSAPPVSDTPIDWSMADFVYRFDTAGNIQRVDEDLLGRPITADQQAASWFEGRKHLVLAVLAGLVLLGVMRR